VIRHIVLMMLMIMFGYVTLTAKEKYHITFEVIPKILPDSSTIYITGNHKELGFWNPQKIPLLKQADGRWSISFKFKSGTYLEYKITRGSWQTEAVSADGAVPSNSILEVEGDTTIHIEVETWKDFTTPSRTKITGNVKYFRNMAGEGIKTRDVIIWLPPSYETNPKARYPVLYMHDGQNLFDPTMSFTAFDWQIDEWADSLIKSGTMKEILVVGIYNTDDRESEYSNSQKGQAYMNFIIQELKPFIDAQFRTKPGAENTATMGSSMGGLISFLLVWQYPSVFSQAGCLSPAFIYKEFNAVQMVQAYEGDPKSIRIYMDNGGVGLEKMLQPGCDKMLTALQQKGFALGENLAWFYDEHAEHNEQAWAQRVWRPLLFMFGQNK